MRSFKILIAESALSVDGGPFKPDRRLAYGIPDEAVELLGPILAPYDADPTWFFDSINGGRPPAPWAIVCLDREYAIAGHICQTRPSRNDNGLVPYRNPRGVAPGGFVPPVGILVLSSKDALERVQGRSPVYEAAWKALSACSASEHWLAILDPLPEDWLAKVVPGDEEAWRTRPMPGSPELPASIEAAIKVSDVGEEYEFMRTATCPCGAQGRFRPVLQSLIPGPSGPMDRMDVRCAACGAASSFFFDVSDTPAWRKDEAQTPDESRMTPDEKRRTKRTRGPGRGE
jgi:hypothetical protein